MFVKTVVALAFAVGATVWVDRSRRRGNNPPAAVPPVAVPPVAVPPPDPQAEVPALTLLELIEVDLREQQRLQELLVSLQHSRADPETIRDATTNLEKVEAELAARILELQPGDPGTSSWAPMQQGKPPNVIQPRVSRPQLGGTSKRQLPKSSDRGLSRATVEDVGPWRKPGEYHKVDWIHTGLQGATGATMIKRQYKAKDIFLEAVDTVSGSCDKLIKSLYQWDSFL
ncbi:hypothetical protein BSKO_04330 [Bryopsis sp. KO-2023]|nr:hypothetical protein BSKO_04330 [Bryopsis sp. KO-2023]